MDHTDAGSVHWSFWVIGAVALLWNFLGAVNFIVQMDPETLAVYRESERAIIEGRPAWATTGFAVAVYGGTIGSLLLLLKKPAAIYLFVASLLGVVVTMVHALATNIEFRVGEIVGIILMPLAVAAFLVWYAKHAQAKRWISQRQ